MLRPRSASVFALGLLVAAGGAGQVRAGEADRIAELLGLRPGMQVADVGAGDGEWSEAMARHVEEAGHVYINEVNDGELIKLRKLLNRSDLNNMSIVEGEPDDTMLPEACCDAILLRLVYHHMSRPDEMRASLQRSLRPGGVLLVIEQDKRGHGVPAEKLIDEMTADGLQVILRHPLWNENADYYAVVFSRPPSCVALRGVSQRPSGSEPKVSPPPVAGPGGIPGLPGYILTP